MSSPSFDATIDLTPGVSLRGLQVVFWLHIVPLALILITLEPGVPMALLAGAMGGSWLWLRRHPALGFGPKALTRLTWHQDGRWTVHQIASGPMDAELLGNSLIHTRLMVLNFRVKPAKHSRGKTHARMLLGDEVDPELLRRLRARLSAK